MIVEANYFDGKTSEKKRATIEFFENKTVELKTDEIAFLESLDRVSISSRVANTPRMIRFSNGGVAYSNENDKIDAILKKLKKTHSIAHLLESKMKYALISLVLLIFSVVFFLTIGSSISAKYIVKIIPYSVEKMISQQALNFFGEHTMYSSTLSAKQKKRFESMLRELTNNQPNYKLHFIKGGKIGANAFALPSGDIILTDELVKLSDGEDRMIYGVLAHEVAHVEYKHSMQLIVKASIASIIVAYFTGDISSIVATASTTLLSLGYSREFEKEADNYAKKKMQEANISPKYLADFFKKMDRQITTKNKQNSYFSSHPSNQERIYNLLK